MNQIWIDETSANDSKVCFRKYINPPEDVGELTLDIWADSRYYLWIDGEFLGTGPSRCWPDFPMKDSYKVEALSGGDPILVAILVWHFGTSNSQYIHGPAGLSVSGQWLSRNNGDNIIGQFESDSTWRCAPHDGYQRPVPRINVSQPWLEMVDANRFPLDWVTRTFSDADWQSACLIVNRDRKKLTEMDERDIPILSSTIRKPDRMIYDRFIHSRGMGIRIDYKAAFYPGDTTTEDRYQQGYISSVIYSPVNQAVTISLADRIWPEENERIILNGHIGSLAPGMRSVKMNLNEGDNLFLLDVSGARQRFTSDLHFLTDDSIEFRSPFSDLECKFVSLGPFISVSIGNIVCTDGFDLESQDATYLSVIESGDAKSIQEYRPWASAIDNVLFDGVKLRGLQGDEIPKVLEESALPLNLHLNMPDGDNDRELVFDMGGEVSGFFEFHVEAPRGTQIDFRFCENQENGNLEIPDDLDTSMRFTCSETAEKYQSLIRRGFRYFAMRMRGSGTVSIGDIAVREVLFPSPHRGLFSSSDSGLDSIWRMCRRTVELCSEDVIVDCPAFEQAYWIGDANIISLFRQYLFGDTRLSRHSLLIAAKSMNYSEIPDCHLPAGVSLPLSTFAQLWFLACYDYWIHTGDMDFLAEIYPWLTKALKAFLSHIDADGIFRMSAWHLLDWAEMDTPYHGAIAHLNARLVECCRKLAEIAGLLEKHDDAVIWSGSGDSLLAVIDDYFWDEERRAYRDSVHQDGTPSKVFSVQTNLMMAKYNCVPEKKTEDIKNIILNPDDDVILPGSPFMAHFFYDYLFAQELGKQALSGIRNQWGEMLDHGTCWETFRGFYKDRLTRSYCHAWSSAPTYLFAVWVLGIRVLEPGFRKIMIAPTPSGLESVEGTVPVPAGDIHVKWHIKDNSFYCEVELPEGIEWETQIPTGNWNQARIDVKSLRSS